MVMLRFALFLLAALLTATPVGASGPTPVGVWLHPNQRIEVEIAPCGDRLCGRMVWFRWPNDLKGLPLLDLKNPDPVLRTQPLLGLTILIGLRRVDDGTWGDGEIYNPDDGESYSALISIETDGSLRVRAYVLFPDLGETMIWTRAR
jgi:uncharacterized protein (DUF2147 family)